MATASDSFEWTAAKEEAALLVAEDRLTDEKIAAGAGVDRRTLTNWKRSPVFMARVDEHLTELLEAVKKYGIGRVENRVRRQDRDWRKLQEIVERRAERAEQQVARNDDVLARSRELGADARQLAEQESDLPEVYPGMETGLIVRTVKVTPMGKIEEFSVDTGLLGELRALETQTAKELGQWVERKDIRASVDVTKLSDEELASLVESEG